jgi:hypothetical protein
MSAVLPIFPDLATVQRSGEEMRTIVRRWTHQDDGRLKALAAQGASIVKPAPH